MKPAAFAYHAPHDLDEALAILAEYGDDAKVLAGGQSLVPMLNFRLLRPAVLVDINRVAGLETLAAGAGLRIGARVRTAALERDAAVLADWPLLRAAAQAVGHLAIRNRGTVCGSAAHADPHAELPAALLALDARFDIRARGRQRSLPAAAFFTDFYTTALGADEVLVAIEVPRPAARTGSAFLEHARTHGDFALAGVAATVTLDAGGACCAATIALLGAGATPLRAADAERGLAGRPLDDAAARAAGLAAAAACDPPEPADYRRALIAELTRRALLTAVARVPA